jgi:hypothetical protein
VLIALAIGLTVGAAFSFYDAWLGEHWKKTKTQSSLDTIMSTDGASDESLTAAKQARAIILYPHRFRMIGTLMLFAALVVWVFVIITSLS